MMKQEMAKYWFEKTRMQVKEEERKLEAKRVFFEEFHFEPEGAYFNEFKRLVVYARFEPEKDKWKIEGKKVKYIEFSVSEREGAEKETEYELIKYPKIYKWIKFTRTHEITIEIVVE